MTFTSAIHDPLKINLRRQTRVLLSKIPSQSPYSTALLNAPHDALLTTLSGLLAVPALTLSVASTFRPILLDLCARWLHDDERIEDRFVALSLLIQPHEELFP
jgi:midasin